MLCDPVTYETFAFQLNDPVLLMLKSCERYTRPAAAVVGASRRALLGDTGQPARRIRIALEAAPPVVHAAEAGVEEQPPRERRAQDR
jgi:hypothetical protein